jgi:hypothetical protein
MHRRLNAAALAALLATPAQAGAPTPTATWSAETLSRAQYLILDPRIEGNPGVVNDEQRAGILSAMRRDSGEAIRRRYPQATIVTGAEMPGAIRVTPVLVAPGTLVPWAKLSARLDFDLPDGGRVSLNDTFGLLILWQHQAEAATYVYGELAKRLP